MLPQSALAQTTKAGTIGENTIALSANLTPTTLDFEISDSVTASTQTADDPTVLTYSNLTIKNLMQTGKLEVEKLVLTGKNGYTAAGDSIDWKNLSVNEKKFSMLASCADITNYDLSNQLRRSVEIQNNGSVTYSFTGHTGISAEGFNGAIAQLVVTVTLKYAEPTAIKLYGNNLTFKTANSTKTWDGTLQTSIDGKTWQDYTAGNTVTADSDKKVIYIRGIENKRINVNNNNYSGFLNIGGSDISVSGDLNSLLDYKTVENGDEPESAAGAFFALFKDNNGITDASDLLLSRPTVKSYEYAKLFHNCTGLKYAPTEIKATSVEFMGCAEMFYNAKITTAPRIYAEKLGYYAFYGTFSTCSKLVDVQEVLPATELAWYCYKDMFTRCSSLKTAPALPATDLFGSPDCYYMMFKDCTALDTPPALPATKLGSWCYREMFSGCTSLKSLPELPAKELAQWCYKDMFKGCTSIKLSTEQSAEYTKEYGIPKSGEIASVWYDSTNSDSGNQNPFDDMFANTGGSFKGTPDITLDGNTSATYYTSNEIVG